MLPESLLIILSLIVPIGLTACIFYILRVYKQQENKLASLQEEKNNLEKDTNAQMQKILEDARSEAIKIIAAANESAKDILTETHLAKDQQDEISQKNLDTLSQQQEATFQKATEDMTKAFQNSINKLNTEDLSLVKKLTQDIETNITKDLGDFKQILEQETISSQKIVGQKIENQYETTRKEVEAYKLEELRKVDQKIQQLIETTSAAVIHKSLSLNDHYDLVQEALQNAKEQLKLTMPEQTTVASSK